MPCLSCGSGHLAELTAEMMVHFPGLRNLDKPGVWMFPKLSVCLDRGFSQFIAMKTDLALLAICDRPTSERSTAQQEADGEELPIELVP